MWWSNRPHSNSKKQLHWTCPVEKGIPVNSAKMQEFVQPLGDASEGRQARLSKHLNVRSKTACLWGKHHFEFHWGRFIQRKNLPKYSFWTDSKRLSIITIMLSSAFSRQFCILLLNYFIEWSPFSFLFKRKHLLHIVNNFVSHSERDDDIWISPFCRMLPKREPEHDNLLNDFRHSTGDLKDQFIFRGRGIRILVKGK